MGYGVVKCIIIIFIFVSFICIGVMAVYKNSPPIVTSGLILHLDASNPNSYSGTGNVWYDLSGQNAHGGITGSVTYVNNGAQSYFNFATAGSSNYISSSLSQSYLDITVVFNPDFTLNSNSSLVGLIGSSTDINNADTSLRFSGSNGTGPWTTINGVGNANDWAFPSTIYYINGNPLSGSSVSLNSGWNIFGGPRTNTVSGSFKNPFAYFIGIEGFSAGVRDYQGKIAACYMYNRTLSSAEQTQNYLALKGRFGL